MPFVIKEGETIGARYRLVRMLAEGGMGQVWVGEHVLTKRRVALKFLRSGLSDDARRRVIKEAQAACAIDHPALACRRMQWLLGGDSRRVVSAASLLDFPPGYSDDAPEDPYAPPELRAKSLAAAAERTQATLDGSVRASGKDFTVELRLLAPDGREAGRGVGTAPELADAVKAASNALGETGAFPVATKTTSEVQRALLTASPDLGWDVDVLSVNSDIELGPRCRRVLAHDELEPVEREYMTAFCHDALGDPVTAPKNLVLTRTSPTGLGFSVMTHIMWGAKLEDVAGLARELRTAAEQEDLPEAKVHLHNAQAMLLSLDTTPIDAFTLYAHSAHEHPWEASWQQGYLSAGDAPSESARLSVLRSALTWAPFEAGNWALTGYGASDVEVNLRWLRRAYEIAPLAESRMLELARRLIFLDRISEARTLAALAAGGDQAARDTSAYLLIAADGADGFPARATAAASRFMNKLDDRLERSEAAARIPLRTIQIAAVIGREVAMANEWAARISKGPLPSTPPLALLAWVRVCLAASRSDGRKCMNALAERYLDAPWLDESVRMYLRGASLATRGDSKGAMRQWRPLLQDAFMTTYLPAERFEAIGEAEIAQKLDEGNIALDVNRVVRGYGIEDLRQARRAWKRGDKAKAKALAKQLIEAWSSLDAEIPWLEELRAMAAD